MEVTKNVLSKIKELADDDKEYLLELKQLYINFFTNLMNEYGELFKNQKSKELSVMIHKIKPAMQYVDLYDLEELLNDGLFMVQNPISYVEKKADENIKEVINICEDSLIKINQI